MTPDKLDQLRRFARAAKQGGTLGGPASIANGVLLLCDEVERLTAERDSLKGLLAGSQQELRDAITAQGRAEQERVVTVHCPTCRCRPAPVCTCGHLPTSHDLPKRKAGYVRTGCSVSEGPKATPCGCTQYEPRKEEE